MMDHRRTETATTHTPQPHDLGADQPPTPGDAVSIAGDAAHVLITGSRPDVVARIRNALESAPLRPVATSIARSFADTMDLLDRVHVDCVLLDLGLPDLEGVDGLSRLLDRHPTTAVVVLSRHDDPLADHAVQLGAQDHLSARDLDARTVHRAVGYAVERARARLAERRLALLLTRASEVVLVIDTERVVTYASASIESVLGYPVEQILGNPGAFFTHPDDLAEFREAVLGVILDPDGPLRTMEIRALHADGSWRWGEVTIANLLDDPAVNGLVLNIRDITERHRAIDELRVSMARRDAIVARSSDLVLFYDPHGTITWASPACRPVLGVEPGDLEGCNGFDFVHPEDRARVFADFTSILRLGDHVRSEFRIIGPTGATRWVEQVCTNLLDEPSVGVVVGNVRDVTDRKAAERAVRFQARLLGAAGQPIVAYDHVGTVLYWNAAAQDTFGWSESEAVGTDVAHLLPSTDASEQSVVEMLGRVSVGEHWTGDLWLRGKSGVEIPVQVSHTPLRDEHGEHVATIGVYTEISQRLQSEATAARLSSIVESSSDAIISHTVDGDITSWNRAASDLYGYTADEVLGRPLTLLAPAERHAEVRAHLAEVRSGRSLRRVGTLSRRADGTTFDAAITMSPMFDSSGAIIGSSTISRDVSERIALQRQLRTEHRRLSDAQASAMLGSFEIDLDTGEASRSAELWRILGRAPGTLDGLGLSHIHPDDRELVEGLVRSAHDGGTGTECTYRIVRPDGEVRWVLSRTTQRESPSRVLTGTVLDITDRREAELKLEHLAFHDALTGLANRTLLSRRLDEVLEATDAHQVAVALLDLDQFKLINDTLGHSVGDTVLQAVAGRLESAKLPGETLARFGGDEFALVSDQCEDPAALGERLLAALDEPVEIGQRQFKMSVSVGVVVGRSGTSADHMFRDADTAMYHAKETGRDRVQVFDESLQRRRQRRVDLEVELRTALERDQLSVVYQPIFELSNARACGFEALLRWSHPTLGPVRPDEFIAVAEETGLILPIGEWVLERSLHQLAEWRGRATASTPADADAPWVAVNVSARQLERPDLVDRVAGALERFGVPPRALHLEITESVLMDTIEHSLETIVALRELGIKISIDDFGTGYSSLSYLKRLPIDTLKIDRSFINGLGTDPDDTSIVQAIASLGHSLHLNVLAEGVETETQLSTLRALRCTHAQGFLWSPGVPPADAGPWLDR